MLYSEFLNIGDSLTIDKVDDILEAYASDIGFYPSIVKANCKDKKTRYLSRTYADKLFLYIYSKWKEDLIRLYKEKKFIGQYQEMAGQIIRYLDNKKPNKYEDVNQILNNRNIDEKTKKALNELKWNRVGVDSLWQYIHSHTVRFYPKEVKAVHRLYINCDSTATHQITYEFIKECDNQGLPYRLKYDDIGNRSDTIVIWTNTKLLPKYVEILRKIKQNPDIAASLYKPPILAGQIDDWIGFASEPKDENGKKTSFNKKREKHITTEINNLQKLFLKRTIVKQRYDYFKDILNKIIDDTVESTIKYAKDNENFYNLKGYRIRDVKGKEFRELITKYVFNHQQDILNYILGESEKIDLVMPYKKSKIIISSYDIRECVRKAFCETVKKDSRMKKIVIDQLKRTAVNYDIDTEKYFLDSDKKIILEKASKKELERTQEKLNSKTIKTSSENKKEISKCIVDKVILYTNENNNTFYVKKYDVKRFDLHSAHEQYVIDNKLCYMISLEDAKKLIAGENNNTNPYKVDIVPVGMKNTNKKENNK